MHRAGKSVEESIEVMAMSSGRQLAHTVQPYGLGSAKGAKFIKRIGNQVDQVWFGTNLGAYPSTGDIKAAHYGQRMNGDKKGNVEYRKFRKERGQKWLDLISVGEKEAYKRKQQAKAGQAKGAWVAAANSVGKAKLSGVAAWIARHDKSSYGLSQKSGEGLKYKVSMENSTKYISYRIQPKKEVNSALRSGLKNGQKHLQHVIDGDIKKANKLLST